MVTFVQSDWPLSIIYISGRKHILVLKAKNWMGMCQYKNDSHKKSHLRKHQNHFKFWKEATYKGITLCFKYLLWLLFIFAIH